MLSALPRTFLAWVASKKAAEIKARRQALRSMMSTAEVRKGFVAIALGLCVCGVYWGSVKDMYVYHHLLLDLHAQYNSIL